MYVQSGFMFVNLTGLGMTFASHCPHRRRDFGVFWYFLPGNEAPMFPLDMVINLFDAGVGKRG